MNKYTVLKRISAVFILLLAIFLIFFNQIVTEVKNFATRTRASEVSANIVSSYNIYNDSLAPGWQEWSDTASGIDLRERKPVFEGSRSISLNLEKQNARLFFHSRRLFDASAYDALQLAVRGTKNGQSYGVQLLDKDEKPLTDLRPLSSYGSDLLNGQWQVYTIPVNDLISDNAEVSGIILKGINEHVKATVYLDSIKFIQYNILPTTDPLKPSPTQKPPSPTTAQVPSVTRPMVSITVRPTATIQPTRVPTIFTPSPTGQVNNQTWWKPTADKPIAWQWQIGTDFTGANNQLVPNVTVYDIDGFNTSASTVSALKAKGFKTICYVSFGTYENWRPDASSFPASIRGSKVSGWAGENWLDIRSDVTKDIMAKRLDMCKEKGFDAVEPDNIDGYTNKTGFPLTAQDQINYNKWMAEQAHARGLSIGLKNDVDQLAALVPYFDWALNEECAKYDECGGYNTTFIKANKAVFQVEYGSSTSQCNEMNKSHINSSTRDLDLVAPGASGYRRLVCIPDSQGQW